MIRVVNFNYKHLDSDIIINTTSRSIGWSRGLSPFFIGPIDLYGEYKSVNLENAWQYSKVYEYYTDINGNPDLRYFSWAQEGWAKVRADRYPMGKGVIPLYSYWDGQKLDYIEARKKIYIPLYSQAVNKTNAFNKLKEVYDDCLSKNEILYLQDFDAHNLGIIPDAQGYWALWNNPNIKVGHSYVLAMLLEGYL